MSSDELAGHETTPTNKEVASERSVHTRLVSFKICKKRRKVTQLAHPVGVRGGAFTS